MKQLIFSIVILSLFGCGNRQQEKVNHSFLTKDFLVSTLSPLSAKKFQENQASLTEGDCLEHLKEVTCYSSSEVSGFDLNCAKKEILQKTISQLENILSKIPDVQRNVLCNINRLQIHTKIRSIGYANIIQDDKGHAIGTMFAFRESAVSDSNTYDLNTWKEQLAFNLSDINDPTFKTSPLGPKVNFQIKSVSNPIFLHVFVHELSHLIDFLNQANSQDCQLNSDNKNVYTCNLASSSFSLLSWPAQYEGKADGSDWPPIAFRNLYPWLSQKCYYDCNVKIPLKNMPDLYQELRDSDFVTSYASSSYMEDFAEASTVFLLKDQGFIYQILAPNSDVLFDLDTQIQEGKLDKKRQWIQNFYSRTNLNISFPHD